MMPLTATAVRRILVVDDSPDVHDDFRKVLCPSSAAWEAIGALERELFGTTSADSTLPVFELQSATQGRAGLELVRRAVAVGEPYSMAFVDVRMPPGWDGLETVRRMWEVDPGLEIVICTAYSDHSWQQVFSAIGQTDQLLILKKPFQVDEARQLALALSTKRALKEAAQLRSADLERLVQERTVELARRNTELEYEIGERQEALKRLARANRARSRHARALSVLLKLSTRLAVAEDVEAIAGHVVAAAARLTRSKRVAMLLPDRERRVLRVVRAVGLDDATSARASVEVGSGLAGRVFADRTAVLINSTSQRLPETTASGPAGDAACFAGAPLVSRALLSGGEAVAVLNLSEHYHGRPYSPRELRNLDTICNMASAAIGEILTRQARDETRDSIVTALATLVESRDNDTGRHLDRVTGYSLILAQALRTAPFNLAEIDAPFLGDLRRAVPLHDIGKVGIPDDILCKPARLTEPEMAVMRRHTEIGAHTIRMIAHRAPGTSFLAMAADIAIGHHERFDGSGYPHGVRGTAIPLAARITAVADVYDALTTVRPYKPAYPHAEAVAIILGEAGRHFDPLVVAAFQSRLTEFAALANELADRPISD